MRAEGPPRCRWERPGPPGWVVGEPPPSPRSPDCASGPQGPFPGPKGFRWSPVCSGLRVVGLSRETRGPYAREGKADKVASRQWPHRLPADCAGAHCARSFAFSFYEISNLAHRTEAGTPKSCHVAPVQTQKELIDRFLSKHYFNNFKQVAVFEPLKRDFLQTGNYFFLQKKSSGPLNRN